MKKWMFPWLVFSSLMLASPSWAVTSLSTLQQADAKNLSFYLNQIIHPQQFRHYQNIEELNRVSSWIKGQMQKFGIPCDFQNYSVNQKTYRNVVCELNVGAAQTVILGAHYDTHEQTPGADDNASGVAGVLESARIFSTEKGNLNHNIEFVFYTLEEPPFFRTEHMGSAVHVRAVKSYQSKIKGVYILEMIGYFSHKTIQEYPTGLKWFYPTHANFIAVVSNFSSNSLGSAYCAAMKQINKLECQRLVAPSFVNGVDFSDHLNYWNQGIPAIMITDTAFFRNKNYHTEQDRIETLNTDKMADVINGLVQTIMTLE